MYLFTLITYVTAACRNPVSEIFLFQEFGGFLRKRNMVSTLYTAARLRRGLASARRWQRGKFHFAKLRSLGVLLCARNDVA